MKYYVYIMSSNNNRVLYIGVTNDLSRRVNEHKSGAVEGFTKRYRVQKLVYAEEHGDIVEAIKREKYLKGWLRKKKEALIAINNPDWKDLPPI